MPTIRVLVFFILVPLAAVACDKEAYPISPAGVAQPNGPARSTFYQPLAEKDTWKYVCRDIKGGGENHNQPFDIENKVVGETTAGGKAVYEFSLAVPQVPSKPLRVETVIQLLANDRAGSVRIYGYLIHGKIVRVPATIFVTAHPPGEMHKAFDYHGPKGKIIDRIFFGLEQSNKTKYGTFEVAPYFESHSTHDYGYARGWGIVEEDHGPNYEVDCLIDAISLH